MRGALAATWRLSVNQDETGPAKAAAWNGGSSVARLEGPGSPPRENFLPGLLADSVGRATRLCFSKRESAALPGRHITDRRRGHDHEGRDRHRRGRGRQVRASAGPVATGWPPIRRRRTGRASRGAGGDRTRWPISSKRTSCRFSPNSPGIRPVGCSPGADAPFHLRAGRGRAANPGAADPGLARRARPRAGRDLPPEA